MKFSVKRILIAEKFYSYRGYLQIRIFRNKLLIITKYFYIFYSISALQECSYILRNFSYLGYFLLIFNIFIITTAKILFAFLKYSRYI